MLNQTGQIPSAKIRIFNDILAGPVPDRVFGNFLEHLGFSIDGGVLAQALANPTFERNSRLDEHQVHSLLAAGQLLVKFFETGGDPDVFPEHWSPGIGATGFGVAALNDYQKDGIAFPWAPMGNDGLVKPSVGRLGGAVRLIGTTWTGLIRPGEILADNEGPTGIRQGIFLPFQRCLRYTGHIWARIASSDPGYQGKLIAGLQQYPINSREVECLACQEISINGNHWQKLFFTLDLSKTQVSPGEPVCFFIRWLPESAIDLLLDQTFLLPDDAVEGIFDPDVLRLVKEWGVPLLRWPGGNFVSHYHWQDGIGSPDRRPTRPNYAWGGLDYNFFGTTEFIHFCRLVNAEPHIVVNSGTGSAEEAANWVEYCNGTPDSTMGSLRAKYDSASSYHVKLWEVGNEIYGSWQGGFHGAEENALRYSEFSDAMRKADPTLELIATGNQFDIANPGPGFDHTQADRQWNRAVIEANRGKIDFLSLHCLPGNDAFLEKLSNDQAYYSLMAQSVAWERVFLPDIQRIVTEPVSEKTPSGQPPIRIAITEWGVLGSRGNNRPIVENFGEVPYAGIFLNMVMRNCTQVPISNATALLHGGCIRKAGGKVFYDPQYLVIQKYTQLAGTYILRCAVESPNYAVETAPDLGLPIENVPVVDAVCCSQTGENRVTVCVVNRLLDQPIQVKLISQNGYPDSAPDWVFITYHDITARAKLGDPDRFRFQNGSPTWDNQEIEVILPPCSVNWVSFTTQTTTR